MVVQTALRRVKICMQAQDVHSETASGEKRASRKAIGEDGTNRFNEDRMVSNKQLTRVLPGKVDSLRGSVEAECYRRDCAVGITNLDATVVPGFRLLKREELVGNFDYPGQTQTTHGGVFLLKGKNCVQCTSLSNAPPVRNDLKFRSPVDVAAIYAAMDPNIAFFFVVPITKLPADALMICKKTHGELGRAPRGKSAQ